ncbi:MAG TPA: zf-HC2 domain-containing protein [Candidatus Coprenecus stercoravium]|uniref:Zf-HC2 domain-containing protein n=1 Tax=Candidatus Coprenecus stercoravium TaxID=2840735 RepID=A0A9D2KAZ1_9BACT|nr:zf-HC2 domain-containing protein [Candidatus Coprenecus stercoravium]
MSRHIDIETLSKYFLNQLSREEETAVQEHLRSCPECAGKLASMRRLRREFFEDAEKKPSVMFRIVHSGWTKAAAAVILLAGIGFFTAETVRNRESIFEQNRINGAEQQDNVLAVDTFDREDSVYYREKYGEDFKF